MPDFRTLDEADVKGKRVLVRVDFNLPMEDGRVTDDTRIQAALPTINDITSRGGRAILIAHMGRPKGTRDETQSLKQIVPAVEAALGKPVAFADDCVGPDAEKAVAAMKDGDVLLLENLRFHAGEEKDDPDFTAKLAKLGDLFVNDAFSVAHRAASSVVGLAGVLPAYAGRSMQAELEALGQGLSHPEHPVAAVVGGAKVSSKIELLGNLVGKVDTLIIGGGMANTFLAANGMARRQEPVRARPSGDRARHPGQGESRRLHDRASLRRRRRERVQGPCREPHRPRRHGRPGRDDPRCRPEKRRGRLGSSRRHTRRSSGTARSAPSRWSPSTPPPSRWRGRRPL